MRGPGKYKTLSDTRQYRGPGGTAPQKPVTSNNQGLNMKKTVTQADMPLKKTPMIGRPGKRGK
jgi:hypothetical protein